MDCPAFGRGGCGAAVTGRALSATAGAGQRHVRDAAAASSSADGRMRDNQQGPPLPQSTREALEPAGPPAGAHPAQCPAPMQRRILGQQLTSGGPRPVPATEGARAAGGTRTAHYIPNGGSLACCGATLSIGSSVRARHLAQHNPTTGPAPPARSPACPLSRLRTPQTATLDATLSCRMSWPRLFPLQHLVPGTSMRTQQRDPRD